MNDYHVVILVLFLKKLVRICPKFCFSEKVKFVRTNSRRSFLSGILSAEILALNVRYVSSTTPLHSHVP